MLVLADVLCGPLAPRRAARLYVLACVAASVCGIVTAILADSHRVAGPVESSDTLAFFLIAAVPLVGTVRTRLGVLVPRLFVGRGGCGDFRCSHLAHAQDRPPAPRQPYAAYRPENVTRFR